MLRALPKPAGPAISVKRTTGAAPRRRRKSRRPRGADINIRTSFRTGPSAAGTLCPGLAKLGGAEVGVGIAKDDAVGDVAALRFETQPEPLREGGYFEDTHILD